MPNGQELLLSIRKSHSQAMVPHEHRLIRDKLNFQQSLLLARNYPSLGCDGWLAGEACGCRVMQSNHQRADFFAMKPQWIVNIETVYLMS